MFGLFLGLAGFFLGLAGFLFETLLFQLELLSFLLFDLLESLFFFLGSFFFRQNLLAQFLLLELFVFALALEEVSLGFLFAALLFLDDSALLVEFHPLNRNLALFEGLDLLLELLFERRRCLAVDGCLGESQQTWLAVDGQQRRFFWEAAPVVVVFVLVLVLAVVDVVVVVILVVIVVGRHDGS